MNFFRPVLLCIALVAAGLQAAPPVIVRMATTTSTDNSGLLQCLLPAFTKQSGIEVHVVAVGTGKALKHGENGDVDVVFVHAKSAEEEFVKNGFGVDRRVVMYNDFVIVGPPGDPAGIAGAKRAADAFQRIANAAAPFVSRGDESGTHKKEVSLWKAAGVTPGGPWYLQAGQGMEPVLIMASEKKAYALVDRGTFIAVHDKLELAILYEGDTDLFNQYGVIAVNPARHPHVKYREAKRFIDWMTSRDGQQRIGSFTVNGKQLFYPNAR